jgi:hypothetical protein
MAVGEGPSKGEGAATKTPHSKSRASEIKSPDKRPTEGKRQSGFASIAEGLFGKPEVAKEDLSSTEAHSKATGLEREAVNLEAKRKKEAAFEKALEAWQVVRVHDQDMDCCELRDRLEPMLERLGENVNADPYRATGKPLRIQ